MTDHPMIPDLSIGSVLGGYRLESVAGRGGMGVVFRATELSLDRIVALKLIASDLAQDVSFRNRFERELTIVASLEHPNVVPVYGAGEIDHVLYIAMRFVRGTDMRALLMQRPQLEPTEVARIVTQLGAALDEAHVMGLVHRDVKPANVIVDTRQHVYLTDFGLSKHVSSTGALTQPGVWVGTPNYIAPEQILAGPVDARADVYSLACLLFEALSGEVPYFRENEMATLFAHVQSDPPSLLKVAPHLPERLEAVIERGMAKDPEDRFPSAGDLALATVAAVERRSVGRSERAVAQGRAALTDAHMIPHPAPGAAPHSGETIVRRDPSSPARAPGEKMKTIVGPLQPAPRRESERPPPPPPPAERHERGGSKQRRLLAAALVGVLLAAAVAVAVATMGGDEGRGQPAAGASRLTPIGVGRSPADVVIGGGAAWIANSGSGTVSRLDERTGRANGAPIEVEGAPDRLAISGDAVFVLDTSAGTLRRIDVGAGGRVGASAALTADDVAAGFGAVWAVNGVVNRLQRLDRDGRRVTESIPVGDFPISVAIGDDAVWVVNSDGGTVSRIDPQSNEPVGPEVGVGKGATQVATDGRTAWVANPATNRVVRIDADGGRTSITVQGGQAVGVGAGFVWVVGDGKLTQIDPKTNKTVGAPRAFASADAVAASDAGVFVVSTGSNSVSRIPF